MNSHDFRDNLDTIDLLKQDNMILRMKISALQKKSEDLQTKNDELTENLARAHV